MATFYQTSIYLCFALMIFNLAGAVVDATNAFPTDTELGQDVNSTSSALDDLTGLDDPNMNSLWALTITLAGAVAIALAWLVHSITPVGIYIFGAVFWTSWIRIQSIIGFGSYLNIEFIIMIQVVIIVLFIAAVIGMLTGSG